MPKPKSNDSARGGGSDRQGNRKNNGRQNISEDNSQLDTGGKVSDGNSVGRGTESPEVGGTGASSEGGELSPKQKDPLEYRSVSLRRSQWEWLDELTLDHALKSVSVFLRQLLDNAREAEEEGRQGESEQNNKPQQREILLGLFPLDTQEAGTDILSDASFFQQLEAKDAEENFDGNAAAK